MDDFVVWDGDDDVLDPVEYLATLEAFPSSSGREDPVVGVPVPVPELGPVVGRVVSERAVSERAVSERAARWRAILVEVAGRGAHDHHVGRGPCPVCYPAGVVRPVEGL